MLTCLDLLYTYMIIVLKKILSRAVSFREEYNLKKNYEHDFKVGLNF